MDTPLEIVWTDYLQHRVRLRGFDLARIEQIVRYSAERYFDTATGRVVAVGRHDDTLIVIPYEADAGTLTPITVHATTRQQISFRLKTGRYTNE
jgi:hypothetical protein